MNLKLLLILTFTGILTISCENNSPDDLEGEVPANVTYNEHVRPIIQSNCIMCHEVPTTSGAPMPLTTYEEVKQALISRPVLDRISRPQGADGMMPLGGMRLSETNISIITKWRDQNFQN